MGRPLGWRKENSKTVRVPSFRVSEDTARWLHAQAESKNVNTVAELLRRIIDEVRQKWDSGNK